MSVSGYFCAPPVLRNLHHDRDPVEHFRNHRCSTVSPYSRVLAVDGLPRAGGGRVIDEWSSEVTLAFERMLAEVSTVQSCFFCFCCILIARVLLI